MRRLLVPASVLAVAAVTAGCTASSGSPAAGAGGKPLPSLPPIDARTQLAGLAATAQDRHFQAGYTLTQPDHPARTVQVILAADGTWRVDVPGGALGGQADVAVAGTKLGLYQCRLDSAHKSCTRVGLPGGSIPAGADPQVEHPFTDWLDQLTDRTAAISVAPAPLLAGARGACFSVEGDSAALAPPVDPGVYCYDVDGTLTALRTDLGTLVLATAAMPAPPTVSLPGPVSDGPPLSTAPPPPPPSASAPAGARHHRRAEKPGVRRRSG